MCSSYEESAEKNLRWGVSTVKSMGLKYMNFLKGINPLTPRDFIKNTKMSPYFFTWILTCFRFAIIYTNPYIT